VATSPDHRSVALAVLDAVRARGALAGATLRLEAERRDLPGQVVAAAAELAYGVLRRRRFLDHLLAGFVKSSLPRRDKRLMTLLRLAMYELAFMDGIPAYATVDRFVRLTGRIKGRRVSGFTNALLREAARAGGEHLRAQLDRVEAPVRLSFPDWIVAAARRAFGDGHLDFLARLNAPAPITIVANGQRGTREDLAQELAEAGLPSRSVDGLPAALVLEPGHSPYQTLQFLHGHFWPQDLGSQLVAELASLLPGAPFLDGCAGNGSKTFYRLNRVPSVGPGVAVDLSRARLEALGQRSRDYGFGEVPSVVADLRQAPFRPGTFGAILVDAPCTGLGTLRRHPELRWRRQEADVATNARLQAELLAAAGELLRPGGHLLFCVCSFLREEGGQVVADFLAARPSFRLVSPARLSASQDLHAILEATRDSAVPAPGMDPGGILTQPDSLDGDCFFAALLEKE